ncbi:MAG: BMP family protein [Bacillota bacterium]
MKKIIGILLVLAMALSMVACAQTTTPSESPVATTPPAAATEAPTAAPEKLKIAMVLPGVINDGGWNAMAYAALMEAQKTFDAEVAYTENVTQNDQVRVERQYAEQGYKIIIGHGFEFGDSLTEVAAEYPDQYFINYGGGVENGKNLCSVQYAYGETGALAGVLIGMSKDITKVGVIMAMENPTGMQEMKNTEATAKKYNPDVEFTYSFTGDWNDIAKAKEAATAALANGAQLILSDLSGPFDGMVQACQEYKAKFYVVTFDGYEKDPTLILGSSVHDATKATLAAIQVILDGKFDGKTFAFGIKDGVMSVGKFGPSVTDEMKAEVAKVQQEIVDGKYELVKVLE